jgi:hypothetical protein
LFSLGVLNHRGYIVFSATTALVVLLVCRRESATSSLRETKKKKKETIRTESGRDARSITFAAAISVSWSVSVTVQKTRKVNSKSSNSGFNTPSNRTIPSKIFRGLDNLDR